MTKQSPHAFSGRINCDTLLYDLFFILQTVQTMKLFNYLFYLTEKFPYLFSNN